MKHSKIFFFSLTALAILCSSYLRAVIAPVAAIVAFGCRALNKLATHALQLSVMKNDDKSPTVVAITQAKQFVLRMIKRDRPVVSTEWRMCPST